MFKWFKNKKKDNKGFTLVELVIVIAILAILVGLLAPQYTKYVKKSRKAADASNMDEMVKVIKVYAADPANELEAGTYTVTITPKSGTTVVTAPTDTTVAAITYNKGNATTATGLGKELKESIPSWYDTNTKSQKWGTNGDAKAIIADVIVGPDGGTSVKYHVEGSTENGGAYNDKFSRYMSTGSDAE